MSHVAGRSLPGAIRAAALLLIGLIGGLGAQSVRADDVPYRHFTTFDGLPSEEITALAQGPNGLLWIGTRNGVAVYDGASFRTIPIPDSISQSPIQDIQPMPDGSAWVGTHLGTLLKTDHSNVRRTLRVGTEETLTRILVRRDTVFFVGTRSLRMLPPGAQQPSRHPFGYRVRTTSEASGAPATVGIGPSDATMSPGGTLWLLDGRRGPGRLRPDGSVEFLDLPLASSGRWWSELAVSAEGDLFLTRAGRLYRWRPGDAELSLLVDDSSGSDLAFSLWQETAYLYRSQRVLRYHIPTGRMRDALGPNTGLPPVSATAILRSRAGGLWIGTGNGLLHLFAPEVRQLETVSGAPVEFAGRYAAEGRTLWATTWGNGLIQLRPRRRRLSPNGQREWVPLDSRDGSLYALSGGDDGWYRWLPDRGWHRRARVQGAVRGFVDSVGTGFFWHANGAYRHPPRDGTSPVRLASWPTARRAQNMLAAGPSGDPILWSGGHVLRLRPADGAVEDTLASVLTYAEASGILMTVGPNGALWCALYDTGLLRLDPESGESKLIAPNRSVREVQVAGDSLVMATSNSGLFLVDARTGRIRRQLTQSDGLLSNTTTGAYLRPDTLYVSHRDGLSLLPTEGLFSPRTSPPALITGLEVSLEDRTLGATLSPSGRTVGFSYSAPELQHSDRLLYEIRLTPRDDEWRTTSRRFARYTDLDPGSYTFEVRARLGDSRPGPDANHAFVIRPHFYETWWFQVFATLGLLALGAAAYRWRIARMRRRQAKLEHAVESRTEALAEEKRRTEEQAERLSELDEAKNRFFAHISHEFRTPLSLILTPLEEALRSGASEAVSFGREQARRMARNARRLERLIEQLLDLATLEASQMDLDRQPGDLAAFVRRVAEAFSSMAKQDNVALEVRGEEMIETKFDADKLESIVSNLLSNAIQYTPAGGQVRVGIRRRGTSPLLAEREEGEAILTVSDTGPGMTAETQDQIFKRFERVEREATGNPGGAGLGLALTRELVELHGGTIEVESKPGVGTTFTVTLPLVRPAEPSAAPAGATSPPEIDPPSTDPAPMPREDGEADPSGDETPPTVLVVEDNAEMRSFLREHLTDRWRVVTAEDGEMGWTAVRTENPDLVLSDVMMPGVSGLELCERIKADAGLRPIPVLLLTARSGSADAVEGFDCGADDYISKPFDMEELKERISNHLGARELLRDHYQKEIRLESLDVTVDEEDVSFLERVADAVQEHLGDPDFTVSRLAEEVALSRRQLTRRLKSALGTTPAAFVRECRIIRARELLAREPETIAEVAYAVGFRSPSAFSKAFGEHVGCTPSEFVEAQSD